MVKWMVSLINSHANATSKRWHLWKIGLRFFSTPLQGGLRINAMIGFKNVSYSLLSGARDASTHARTGVIHAMGFGFGL